MAITVLVADQREVIRSGLRHFLTGKSVEIVAEAVKAKDVLPLAKQHKPQVLLLGRFPETSGLDTLRQVKQKLRDLPVVIFGKTNDLTYAACSMAWGASGYLSEDSSPQLLVATLEAAASGQKAWTPEQLRRLTGAATIPAGVEVSLTKREWQVLRQLALGLPNREISLMLEISTETVKEHMQNILGKLKFSDRTKAAVWAIRKGVD